MAARLLSLTFDALDPAGLAAFWASTLGWIVDDDASHDVSVEPTDGTPFALVFVPTSKPKRSKNPIHLDLVAESLADRTDVADRLVALGARHVDVGQSPDDHHVVLADPEGNEFCIVVRGEFLADTGFLGAVVFEPAHPVTGYFWGDAIGWPIVYDEDGDVALRSPDGRGPFLTFGPPGVNKQDKNRIHLDLRPDGTDLAGEVERLIGAGARRVDIGQGDVPWVVLADPDGNELCVLPPPEAS